MKDKHNINQLFSDSLRNLKVAPPAENWDEISKKLQKKKRRLAPFWWRVAASFVLFLSVGTYVLKHFDRFNMNSKMSDSPRTNQVKAVSSNNGGYLPNNSKHSNIKNTDSVFYKNNNQNKYPEDRVAVGIQSSKSKGLTTTNQQLILFTRNQQISSIKQKSSAVKNDVASVENYAKRHLDSTLLPDSAPASVLSMTTAFSVIPFEFSKSLSKIYPKAAINKLAVAQSEPKQKKHPLTSRWWIGPVMAPLIASAVGNDSPIDPKFANNDKQFKSVTSYGIQAQYAVTKQFSIRSGVQSIAFEYSTNDIVFWEGYQNTHLENVRSSDQLYLQIESGLANNQALNKNSNNGIDGQLHQRSSYIEWPVEGIVQWKLNRWFFECSGGMSTLFLQENRIYLTGSGISMTIGEASNLSRVHYSANIGMGAGYFLKNDLSLSISPNFKYQLNTYSNNNGNFSPYVLGFYGGIKYRF